MNLFRSKLAKVEAFVSASAKERTPDLLGAAQSELDALDAGVIMVPKTDTIKTAADLQQHLDTLEAQAKTGRESQAKLAAAEKQVATLMAEMEALRTQRVLPSNRVTADKDKGGDLNGELSAEKQVDAIVHDPSSPWNQAADEMGFILRETKTEPKTTENTDDAR